MARNSSNSGTPHRDRKNECFGCGAGNPDGLGLKFQPVAQARPGTVRARCKIPRRFHGAPGILHGGIVATLLDEAMAKTTSALGLTAMTHELTVEYRKMVPTSRWILIEGRHRCKRGRYVYQAAEIRDEDGTVLARGRGRFVMIDRERIQALRKKL